jgi:hypothetical protein
MDRYDDLVRPLLNKDFHHDSAAAARAVDAVVRKDYDRYMFNNVKIPFDFKVQGERRY